MQYKNLNSDERREAVKLLYSNALSGIGVSALVSFVLVFAFDLTDERTNQEKIIWLFFYAGCFGSKANGCYLL